MPTINSTTRPLTFDTNGLYALLSDRGSLYNFHWGLYLAKSPTTGVEHHLKNEDNWCMWNIKISPTYNVVSFSKLKVALKVAVLDSVLHDCMGDRLREIPTTHSAPFPEVMSCRFWLKEALTTLDELGYIKLMSSVAEIEEEAIRLAEIATERRGKVVGKRAGTEA
ncbi:hypothetical protein BDV29DRAFT_163555 [Aspergillus leporis]|jgi:hypothetical protein|uniref:Uncharacterized protein n=1 Tax=Aspergillus leporis TaxID=41062 RepID=A0A5N5WIZ2_9EURO|nr:hypothetical protein BDV29DRAFT_163555 [Aspergillus leporis]